MSQGHLSPKPTLTIEIQNFQDRIRAFQHKPSAHNEHSHRHLRTVKTAMDLRKTTNEQEFPDLTAQRKIRKLTKLEDERINLLSSLEVLKTSAVEALAQKQAEIERLRGEDPYSIQEQCEKYERELERNQSIQSDLQQEREYLMYQLRCERQRYLHEIEEKEEYIEQLHQEIEMLRREIEQLHYNNQLTHQTLRTLQDQNSRLSLQLGESCLAKSDHSPNFDLDETLKVGSRKAFSMAGFLPPLSVVSSQADEDRRRERFYSQIEPYKFANEEDQQYMESVLDEEKRRHRRDLCEVKEQYQQQINQLRDIYARQLRLPTEQDENSSQHHRPGSHSSSRKRLDRHDSSHPNNEFALSIRDMEAIDEAIQNEVLQTSRSNMHDLKYEIKMQNLSQCPSIRFRPTQDDAESQFTMRYFQNPFTVRRHRSIESIQVIPAVPQHKEESSPLRKQRSTQEISCHSACPSELELESYRVAKEEWSKPGVFAAGVLSGVGLASLTYLISRLQQR